MNTKFPLLPADATPTAQEVFDAVRTWSRTMPERCEPRGGGCLYRTSDGRNACFVGALLTDDEVRGLDAPGAVFTAVDLTNSGRMPARLVEHTDLLQALQDIHDQHRERTEWPREFERVAHRFNLT